MKNTRAARLAVLVWALFAVFSCTDRDQARRDLANDPFPQAQAELAAVVEAIARDAMRANVTGLQAIHLQSDKFTKFGPRRFERQDVATANASEADYFTSISQLKYEARDLKVDVFGDVGVVTYYPRVSFVKDGEHQEGSGRQTLIFLRTSGGWKIVHEHGTPRF